MLLVPALNVQAQGLTEEEGPFEGGDIDITLEFKSNGRLSFDITAQGETSAETGGFGEDIQLNLLKEVSRLILRVPDSLNLMQRRA